MAKEDFNQVSSRFEAVQCILSSILCPSIFRQIAAIRPFAMPLHFSAPIIIIIGLYLNIATTDV
jgi:hypothetical protein